MRPPALPLRVLPLASAALALGLPARAQTAFDAAFYVPGSDSGEFRGHGDFDGDGRQDLLHTTNWLAWSGMRVFLGRGDGTFEPQAETAFQGPPGFEYALADPAIGDFDGDGRLDVAIDRNSVLGADGVVVYWGDGLGGFTGSTTVELGIGVSMLHAGQADADPADEIYVKYSDASYQAWVAWLHHAGGGFQLSTPLPAGAPLDAPGSLLQALGDLDGDGDDDAVATTVDYAQVRVYPTVGGATTLGAAFDVPPQMQNVNHRLRAADLDADGDVDVVHLKMFLDDVGPWVQVYENAGGALVQRPAQSVATPTLGWFQPHNLRLGDWNGDGRPDLISHGSDLDVLRSNGDLTFAEGFTATSLGQAAGGGAVDVDGDGFCDVVGTRAIFFGRPEFQGPKLDPPGPSLTYPDGIVPADLEGDGDVDALGGPFGGRATNDGTAAWTAQPGPGGGASGFFPPPPAPGYSYRNTVAFADLDGDGRRDYIAQLWFEFIGGPGFVEMRLLRDDGTGAFVDAGVAAPALVRIDKAGAAPDEHWETADADGDGDLDLLVDGGYWRNAGVGQLDAYVAAYSGRAFDGADVDGDGDVDLVARSGTGPSPIVLLRKTPGGFAPTALGSVAGAALARFVDLDLDGDADVAAGDPAGSALLVAENVGGAFAPAGTIAASARNLRLLGVADVDGDGIADLVTLRKVTSGLATSAQLVSVHRGAPGLAYAIAEEYVAPIFAASFEGLLDADADGDLDVVGKHVLLGQTIVPPDGGITRQFGQGFAGTGGVVPVLGAHGPATSTNPDAEMRVVQAVGGGLAWLAFGPTEVAVPDRPLPGMTLYVGAPSVVGPLPLGGAPGVAGAGVLVLPLPHLALLHGVSFAHQAFVLDPGSAVGWSATNGLQIVFGL